MLNCDFDEGKDVGVKWNLFFVFLDEFQTLLHDFLTDGNEDTSLMDEVSQMDRSVALNRCSVLSYLCT
jgi:hypothetical protein